MSSFGCRWNALRNYHTKFGSSAFNLIDPNGHGSQLVDYTCPNGEPDQLQYRHPAASSAMLRVI